MTNRNDMNSPPDVPKTLDDLHATVAQLKDLGSTVGVGAVPEREKNRAEIAEINAAIRERYHRRP